MTGDLRSFNTYRLLVTAYFFLPVQVALLEARGLSFAQILFLNTVYNLVAVAFEVPTGALADRVGRRPAMALGALSMACGAATYAWAQTFPAFAVAESLFAIGMSLSSGSDSAWLFDRLKSQKRLGEYAAAEGTASAWKHVGTMLACVAGGALALVDPVLPYVVTALVCLAAAVVALRLSEAPAERSLSEARWGGYVPHMRESLKVALSIGRLRSAILYSALVFVLLRISLYVYQPYLRSAGFDLLETSFVQAVVLGVAAIASRQVGRDYAALPTRTLVLGLPLVLGLSYFVMAGTHGAGPAIALLMMQAVVNGAYSPVSKNLVNREIGSSTQRATVLSVESVTRRLAFAGFSAFLGLIIARGGFAAGFVACGLVGFGGVAVMLVRLFARPKLQVVRDEDVDVQRRRQASGHP